MSCVRVSEAFFTSRGHSESSEASERHTTSRYSGRTRTQTWELTREPFEKTTAHKNSQDANVYPRPRAVEMFSESLLEDFKRTFSCDSLNFLESNLEYFYQR